MKVVIKSYEESNEEIKVAFSSNFGEGIALWQGAIPKEGNSYDVELEIPNLLKWDKDIQETKSHCYLIEILDNRVCFEGKLESFSEEDSCCVVRLGDSIILLETEGVPSEVQSYLRFETDNIILYENNI
ncbi:hypothetical protein [Lysinibacillus odysseyi]|uniref:Uncharacterized protein n=1 Tax=Lysinibacillus odysseyi 34hs-1 = NBRC 100172 TaxID=1220589 RepID=A0A0A3JB62_9BACI|nr:hypothetical protein [Lysinibacillus odysseyi]KGR84257.1 hypothetical protein CD32_11675 [Lysinibacillus odysseyi 34hs-1 = NBRC 100172]